VGLDDVGEMFADDVAAGRAKDVADEEDIHLLILARVERKDFERKGSEGRARRTPRKA